MCIRDRLCPYNGQNKETILEKELAAIKQNAETKRKDIPEVQGIEELRVGKSLKEQPFLKLFCKRLRINWEQGRMVLMNRCF